MKILLLGVDKTTRYILKALRAFLFATFVYKGWLAAEMQYNAFGGGLGSFALPLIYILMGVLPYLMFLLGSSMAYNSYGKSKYAPIDEYNNGYVTRNGFNVTLTTIACVSNIIAGSLNFVAYFCRASITFVMIVMPTIMAILTIITMLLVMLCAVGTKNARQLFVSMAIPCVFLLLLLR